VELARAVSMEKATQVIQSHIRGLLGRRKAARAKLQAEKRKEMGSYHKEFDRLKARREAHLKAALIVQHAWRDHRQQGLSERNKAIRDMKAAQQALAAVGGASSEAQKEDEST